jgi:hypothetical protein
MVKIITSSDNNTTYQTVTENGQTTVTSTLTYNSPELVGFANYIGSGGRTAAEVDWGGSVAGGVGCQRRRQIRPRGGAKLGQWRGAKRHGARAPQIAGACHGALAHRANPATGDQVETSAFRARLWPSR